jgi:hypothetical protein
MADVAAESTETAAKDLAEGGSYEVLRARLQAQAQELSGKADALNTRRKEVFGGTELAVVGNVRVRTENACKPAEIVSIGDLLLIGYSVYIGLKAVTVPDVFSLHRFVEGAEGFDFPGEPIDAGGGFLQDATFLRQLKELFQYYKAANLIQLTRTETKLLAIFQVGATPLDVKVFRWDVTDPRHPVFIDDRGERDHVFPPSHDFEWTATTRANQVSGKFPHVSIEDAVFVETVGGDLTIKVENNTEDGLGVYSEPVEDADQSLDDAQILYARKGEIYLLKVLPFREQKWRYFVYNKRQKSAVRIDAIGQACVALPEDHGLIFPGGYYLQTGEHKVFEGDPAGLEYQRLIRSPNGEDVLYVFLRRVDGTYVLLPYNLIRKEVQNPIHCHAYALFGDGKMPVFRVVSDEPSRVHPLQIWQTPFTTIEQASAPKQDRSYLAKVGNAELVRGISDAYSLARLIERQRPSRQTYEEVVAATVRLLDGYYWLAHEEAGNLQATLQEVRKSAELIVDEFEKVVAIRGRADAALADARKAFVELSRTLRPEALKDVDSYMRALTALRHQRGMLTGLREMRYMDLEAVKQLEQQIAAEYDKVGAACAEFLATDAALRPLLGQIDELLGATGKAERTVELKPVGERIQLTTEGLNVLSEIAGGLQAADPTVRTRILEGISEVFGQLNRLRATYEGRRRELGGREGRSEFAAQFKLLGQNIESALARATTPEACDEQLSRVMLQVEEVEGRFSEFDDFVAELTKKREEAYEAFSGRKQALLEERQRRALTLFGAADRILDGVGRRARGFASPDELNAYFASDPMLVKLRELIERLRELGDSVKSDELESRLKTARQDALRLLRDRSELFEDGATVIRLGRHRFSVSTEPVELTMVPRAGSMVFHLTGTDYYGAVEDETFGATAEFWEQSLVSETPRLYRGEFLTASLLFAAETAGDGLAELTRASLEREGLFKLVRVAAAERYDEGYERGVHDADAALILDRLLAQRATAGLLRFSPTPRALACLGWMLLEDQDRRASFSRRARSLGRLRAALGESPAAQALAGELAQIVAATAKQAGLTAAEVECQLAGRYLVEELMADDEPSFSTSAGAIALHDALMAQLEKDGTRRALETDLALLAERPGEALALALAWVDAFLLRRPDDGGFRVEAAVLLLSAGQLPRRQQSSLQSSKLEGLLGQHPRIIGGAMDLRLDEFLERLGDYQHRVVPRFREYRKLRQSLVSRERERLRLDEFKPRVLTTFVRNRLINEVYLPLIGDNLAKQLGALGDAKRTDLMGMLLLISPPGYGKTTLMEYLASQLGLIFMKINGPALGHGVTSLDPAEAGSATARQEVDKINLALEMGNNVMLYLDDIQHTNPELLQKFISLCDAQRKIEGVWRGRTRTYDLRGKKFCMVMAGNPYTESGGRFKIPDMLANRADTYNLGDILSGKDDLFALSYLENALTSNPTLAPLASRAPEDLQLLIGKARGQEVATTQLSYPYSAVEIADIAAVLRHLFRVQETLLKVNQEYIRSAAMEQAFRTEPGFQLQGSYRNMNKLAEKVVPALNDAELDRLVDDHYQGEAQTLTTGAEQNLLKLGELRGRHTPEQAARWAEIKQGFKRLQRMGGSDEDPVTRVVSQLGDIGEGLDAIRQGLLEAASKTGGARDAEARRDQESLRTTLSKLDEAMAKLQRPELDVKVTTNLPPGFTDLLDHQIALVERIINPLMLTVSRSIEKGESMRIAMMALVDDLKRIDQQMKQATPEELTRLKQIRERDEGDT